ncbi:hypothetical protein AgCh_031047 [Apium graveolens]
MTWSTGPDLRERSGRPERVGVPCWVGASFKEPLVGRRPPRTATRPPMSSAYFAGSSTKSAKLRSEHMALEALMKKLERKFQDWESRALLAFI